jgi:hypothetical protein
LFIVPDLSGRSFLIFHCVPAANPPVFLKDCDSVGAGVLACRLLRPFPVQQAFPFPLSDGVPFRNRWICASTGMAAREN